MLIRPSALSNSKTKRLTTPNFIAQSIQDIDWQYLIRHGVTTALIDLDGTVVARNTYDVDPKTIAALQAQPLRLYIATNRPRYTGLRDLEKQLGTVGVIHPTGIWAKPSKRYYSQAASLHGLKPSELVMIGDRYFQDIYGANRAGLRTIVVNKLDAPANIIDRIVSGAEHRRTNRLISQYLPIID